MGDKTLIEWTEASWPVMAGCTKVSPACDNCYAIRDSWRMAHNPNRKVSGAYEGAVEKRADGSLEWSTRAPRLLEDRLDWPGKWGRGGKGRRIFVCNMSDLFHPLVPSWFINEIWIRIRNHPEHTFQILTKRPERLLWWTQGAAHAKGWPVDEIWPENAWLGITAETQEWFDRRWAYLCKVQATVRFVSYEPALGPLDLAEVFGLYEYAGGKWALKVGDRWRDSPDWVICGGESGPNARPMHPDWARSLRDQCAAAGVPLFFKQWGEWLPGTELHPAHNREIPKGWPDRNMRWISLDGSLRKLEEHGWKDGDEWVARLGKRTAGHMLDGQEYREFPGAKR